MGNLQIVSSDTSYVNETSRTNIILDLLLPFTIQNITKKIDPVPNSNVTM